MPLWEMHFLGGVRLMRQEAGGAFRAVPKTRHSRVGEELLAYLALHPRRAHTREELLHRLNLEKAADGGRNRLRVELSGLRDWLEPTPVPQGAVLVTDGTTVHLSSEAYRTDVSLLESLFETDRRAAVDLYRESGPLLPATDSAWIVDERNRLDVRFRVVFRELISEMEQSGDTLHALSYALAALQDFTESDDELTAHALELTRTVAGDTAARGELDRLVAFFGEELPEDLRAVQHALYPPAPLVRRGRGRPARPKTPSGPITLAAAQKKITQKLTSGEWRLLSRLAHFTESFAPEVAAFVLCEPRLQEALPHLLELHAIEAYTVDRSEWNVPPVTRYRLGDWLRPFLETRNSLQEGDALTARFGLWLWRQRSTCYRLAGRHREFDYSLFMQWAKRLALPEWANFCAVMEDLLVAPDDGNPVNDRRFRIGVHFYVHSFNLAVLAGETIRHGEWAWKIVRQIHRLKARRQLIFAQTASYLLTTYPQTSLATQESRRLLNEWAFQKYPQMREATWWKTVPPEDAYSFSWILLNHVFSLGEGDSDHLLRNDKWLLGALAVGTGSKEAKLLLGHGGRNLANHLMQMAHFAHQQSKDAEALQLYMLSLEGLNGFPERAEALAGCAESLRVQGRLDEAWVRFEEAIEEAERWGDALLLNHVRLKYGDFLQFLGEYGKAERLLDAALDYFGGVADSVNLDRTQRNLGILHLARCQFGKARLAFQQSANLCHERGDQKSGADAERGLALIALRNGRWDEARRRLLSARKVWEEDGHDRWLAVFDLHLAEVAYHTSNNVEAYALLNSAEAHVVRTSAPNSTAFALYLRGLLACRAGNLANALHLHREALKIRLKKGGKRSHVESLEAIAAVLMTAGEMSVGAELWGVSQEVRNRISLPRPPSVEEETAALTARIRRSVNDAPDTLPSWDDGVGRALNHALPPHFVLYQTS